jgi:hypothetical protein
VQIGFHPSRRFVAFPHLCAIISLAVTASQIIEESE